MRAVADSEDGAVAWRAISAILQALAIAWQGVSATAEWAGLWWPAMTRTGQPGGGRRQARPPAAALAHGKLAGLCAGWRSRGLDCRPGALRGGDLEVMPLVSW
jgi:hypothetical protein